jgi:periplasmic protein TonB
MSSIWPSAVTSLDDHLALLTDSMGRIEAARSVELSEVIEQLKAVVDASQTLQGLIFSELPDATWQDRNELEAVLEEIAKKVEARNIEQRRARLRALAEELEVGAITHRRAARAAQLKELRDLAVAELRSLADDEAPPPVLPGPEAYEWVEWACSLQEPDDSESLQAIRQGFSILDEFVANLEPGMWNTDALPKTAAPGREEIDPLARLREIEQRRARILTLAAELEGGTVIHNRAARVQQLNQLRDEAVQELRSQASPDRAPRTLPGPDAPQWVEWACSLKEPEDAEALQILRTRFPHLDEFVVNLEADMWNAAGAAVPERAPESPKPPAVKAPAAASASSAAVAAAPAVAKAAAAGTAAAVAVAPAPERAQKPVEQKPVPKKPVEQKPVGQVPVVVSLPVERATSATATTSTLPASTSKSVSATASDLTRRLREMVAGNLRIFMIVAGVFAVVLLVGALEWSSHRKHTSSDPVSSVEAKVPDGAPSSSAAPTTATTTSAPAPPVEKTRSKEQAANKPVAPQADSQQQQQQQQQPNVLDASLRAPSAMPKAPAPKPDDSVVTPPSVNLSGGNGLTNVVDVPVTQPQVSREKLKISSGVAQGSLIRQIAPVYPRQARLDGIQGTVVLQATVGKDGKVRSVHALGGPPMLIQPAVDAVKQWRYKPFSLNGEPAEAEIQINVKFTP